MEFFLFLDDEIKTQNQLKMFTSGIYLPNISSVKGCDTRSGFKQGEYELNSVFFFY